MIVIDDIPNTNKGKKYFEKTLKKRLKGYKRPTIIIKSRLYIELGTE